MDQLIRCSWARSPLMIAYHDAEASTIQNAKAFGKVQKEFGSFDSYVWSFVGGTPRVNEWRALNQIPLRGDNGRIQD